MAEPCSQSDRRGPWRPNLVPKVTAEGSLRSRAAHGFLRTPPRTARTPPRTARRPPRTARTPPRTPRRPRRDARMSIGPRKRRQTAPSGTALLIPLAGFPGAQARRRGDKRNWAHAAPSPHRRMGHRATERLIKAGCVAANEEAHELVAAASIAEPPRVTVVSSFGACQTSPGGG